jgi:hypothetical protein
MRVHRADSLVTLAFVSFAVMLASVSAGNSRNQSQPAVATGPSMPTEVHVLYSGLWRTDGGFVSTIRVKNVLVVAPMDVTPVLFMADGTPYMLSPVHIAVFGVATVNINDPLAAELLGRSIFENSPRTSPATTAARAEFASNMRDRKGQFS